MSRPNLSAGLPRELPLIGRGHDLEDLYTIFGDPGWVEPVSILTGEGGVGKSRLARTCMREAERREWSVTYGRAYPVEVGVPYALVSDAFLPLLKELDEATLAVLTRGTAEDLKQLFPALGAPRERPAQGEDPRESKLRVYWNFAEFLKRLGERQPLLVILEDLHWADPSSLSLIHFVARQLADAPVRLLCTYNTDYRDGAGDLVEAERSLLAQRQLRLHPLTPLTREDIQELLGQVFHIGETPGREYSQLLYGWTRGNPYFIEETLKSLVESGRLYQRDGTWLGWEARELELPSSIRDAIVTRLRGLSPGAGAVIDVLSVVGGRGTFALLEAVCDMDQAELLEAVDELVRPGLVDEGEAGGHVVLEFRHPLVRETLYQQLGLTRRRTLHAEVAEALEKVHGAKAEEHADELAFHFSHAGTSASEPRAIRYLALAGRAALSRHAHQEAAEYLKAAVSRLTEGGPAEDLSLRPSALKADLARAETRLGHYPTARELWEELLEEAGEVGDRMAAARAHRHLGLLAYWGGRHPSALEHYEEALESLKSLEEGHPVLEARLLLATGVALQELGRGDEARARVERALEIASAMDAPALLGRVHRALALLYTWIGEPDEARKHGWRAVELADTSGDGHVRFWGRWALSCLEGLTGNTGEMDRLLRQAQAVAEELRSPVLRLWAAELAIEYAYATGDWDGALAVGEQSISLASALNQKTLLPRLLVWTSMVYLGRGDVERGRELVDRAWTLAGLDGGGREMRPSDVHVVVPAHIGRAALLMAEGDVEGSIRVGQAGLEIADRSGYVIWVLHRLLPLIGEAYIRAEDLDGAIKVGERLRTEAQRMSHKLGLAWADTCDAIVAWHSGDIERAAVLLRDAAEALEAVPMIPEATRLRRQLAGRLADLGDREGALTELRTVHDIFGSLGAQPELEKARGMFREVGSRPPSRSEAEGAAELTGRETDVARLVADRKSNKAIAKELGISPRTVTTHLSNIYRKLDINSRGELADLVREARLPGA